MYVLRMYVRNTVTLYNIHTVYVDQPPCTSNLAAESYINKTEDVINYILVSSKYGVRTHGG